MQQTKKLNKYDQTALENLSVILDGEEFRGYDLIGRIVVENAKGDYTLYNMVTEGVGKSYNHIAFLLSKIGVE